MHTCAVEVPTLHSKMSVATMSDVESAETFEQPDDELFILPGISDALCLVYNWKLECLMHEAMVCLMPHTCTHVSMS